MALRTRMALSTGLACLPLVSSACGGAMPGTARNDALEQAIAKTGMSICADGGASSGCTQYTAAAVRCADQSREAEGHAFRSCKIDWTSAGRATQSDTICAALSPDSAQGYAVKPLDACSDAGAATGTSADAYATSVPAGLDHRMTPGAAAAAALVAMPDGHIDRVDLLANEGDVQRLKPGAGSPGAHAERGGPVWVVSLHGTFTGTHAPTDHTGSGYYIIDDRTGDVLELGWP